MLIAGLGLSSVSSHYEYEHARGVDRPDRALSLSGRFYNKQI